MLLRHPWLAPLMQRPAIAEDSEAEAAAEGVQSSGAVAPNGTEPSAPQHMATLAAGIASGKLSTADEEVGAWARDAIEKRRRGKLRGAEKPALHAAPLDAVPSPAATEGVAEPETNGLQEGA